MAPSNPRVVVAVDKSKVSLDALCWALEKFGDQEVEFHLVHVVASEEQVEPAKDQLRRKFAAELEKSGVTYVEDVIVDTGLVHDVAGKVSANICRKAKELEAMQVVVGKKEHGFFRKLLLSSVSKHVVENCEIPVTVITVQNDMKFGSCPV